MRSVPFGVVPRNGLSREVDISPTHAPKPLGRRHAKENEPLGIGHAKDSVDDLGASTGEGFTGEVPQLFPGPINERHLAVVLCHDGHAVLEECALRIAKRYDHLSLVVEVSNAAAIGRPFLHPDHSVLRFADVVELRLVEDFAVRSGETLVDSVLFDDTAWPFLRSERVSCRPPIRGTSPQSCAGEVSHR
jgi:hypothetical protein